MSGMDGLSDGDQFGHVNHPGVVFTVRNSTQYGTTLRSDNGPLAGFIDLPDYHAFVRAVNGARP